MSDNMCKHGRIDGNCIRCKDAEIARLKAEVEFWKERACCHPSNNWGHNAFCLKARAEAAEAKVEKLIELVSKAAPVTWCGTGWTWMDAAVAWEKEAVEILDKA